MNELAKSAKNVQCVKIDLYPRHMNEKTHFIHRIVQKNFRKMLIENQERTFEIIINTYYAYFLEPSSGYLVWNPKCHMLSKNPLDPSITKFVKREKFENCSNVEPLTRITRVSNGNNYLVINADLAKNYKQLSCCWAPIVRIIPSLEMNPDKDYDSKIR